MKKNWTAMKNIIHASQGPGELFLSLINEKGTITCVNTTMQKELHLDDLRSNSINFFDLLHPAHVPGFRTLFNETIAGDTREGIEIYIKNGHYRPMKWHVNYLRKEKDSTKTYLCLGYNILDNERRRKFNNLVKQNYQLLIENLSGIIFHDSKGNIVATNPKTAAIFNTSLEHLYKVKNMADLWNMHWEITNENGEPVSFDNAPFVKATCTGLAQQETLRIRTSEGKERWVLFNSQPLPDQETGGESSVVSSIIDISNEKQLSIKLKEKEALIHQENIKRQKEISEAVIQAEEKERTQIGRELHDNVNQLLSATKLFVSVLNAHTKEHQQVKQKSLDYIQLAIDEIRKVSKELVAPQVKEQGLVESIQGMIDDLALVSDLNIRFEHDSLSNQLNSGRKLTIFRVVQEQLKNILKHSGAHNTFISLQSNQNKLQLRVEDDGKGFNPDQHKSGIGLSNIQERVKFYNGTVNFDTAEGKGCRMQVCIPVQS
jgi:signal transduction histidine kinase